MTTYPLYRKYKGIGVWFKIVSESEFIEVKQVGERLALTSVTANVYPEFVLISDMIALREGRWEEAGATEVEELIAKARSNIGQK
jgi:hypothetical protein